MIDIMTVLVQSNPVPDPVELVDSPEGRALAMRRPESIIDWQASNGEFEGAGYRIRHLTSKDWEVAHRGKVLKHTTRQSSAFSVVEHHRRESLWRRDLMMRAAVAFLAIIAFFVLAAFSNIPGVWFLGIIVIGIGFAGTVRFFSILNRHVDDPYRRPLPWERVSWWRRLRGR